ncbi:MULTISPECIES: TetR/AcrR family transcriptional regulator [Mycobacteriaceae]|uniref:Transcriptional regulator n=1 Tax=Mycolicibacterium novocastrense TaxID=59813 RepID=A0AAW5SRW6_MYCNV|nr:MULTISPECIES: TetR/AcrR family transcriptional regulator [Mycolicibacterium]KUH64584.1 TetR family transcriptional regulator [Mycolicibacterium novocastrense]KUH64718.1 TetR family transcriptional regulator [Mycolicibacterium novocastrense]KUH76862.1 TetR family transcriptional regulator [Mycolicibacterium novocastrense]MCV7026300.1 TetR/AcrR family transcriptional regulator [Mycolicibacterium novocastrense]CRL77729.1 transcriptional regulator [Mycolicibacterium malmesburyense]
MATERATAELDEQQESDRRDQILEAANLCFSQLGIQRTSVQDVARVANVSRGTVYRYFEDRTILIEAAIEYGAQKFYQEVAAAMAKKSTLAEKLGAMAETHARILLDHRTRNRLMADDAELMRHMIADGDSAVRRTTEFLVPYVREAQERGEVGANIDVKAASEWLARIIYSFSTVNKAQTFDMSKPTTVRRYVEKFAVNGLR